MATKEVEVVGVVTEVKPGNDSSTRMALLLVGIAVLIMVLTPVITIITIKNMIPVTPEGITKTKTPEVKLPPIQVNVGDTHGQRYAQVRIAVTVTDKNSLKFFEDQTATNEDGQQTLMMATVNEILSGKNLKQLLDVQSRQRLKKEIQVALNKILEEQETTAMVQKVYFPEFIVQ